MSCEVKVSAAGHRQRILSARVSSTGKGSLAVDGGLSDAGPPPPQYMPAEPGIVYYVNFGGGDFGNGLRNLGSGNSDRPAVRCLFIVWGHRLAKTRLGHDRKRH